jgi:hypothetical protein
MRSARFGLLAVVFSIGLTLGCNNKPAPVSGGGGSGSTATMGGDNTTAGAAAETPVK